MFQPTPIQPSNFGAITADQNLIENPALMYLATLGSKDSYRCMKSKLNKFARFFGYKGLVDCDWKSMQPNHVTVFLTAQSWGSARTYNCYLSALKSVALNAWRNKQIDLDHFQRIKSLKQRRVFRAPSGRAISSEESASLIKSLEANSLRTVRNRAIFYLMLGCGLRRAEVCELRVKQVSFKNRSAKIIGKGNKERTIYFPDAVLDVLKTWFEFRQLNKNEIDAGFVFGRIDNKLRLYLDTALDPSSVSRIIEKLVTETENLDCRLTPHDLRRTFATRLISKNVDIVEVQKLMGHASVATTGNYVRKDEENLRKAAEKAEL
ncbi:tyrosine-type recombinase/integrase [uncultured Parasutterella sp.]|uniref:tyrosine-type recombinase/integrase n=1 Tax=uncultured Parasutterella sp. TaxID=1263098 RepID=UPI0026226B63|nr:tyrosine-type recombinase/integrase [uncultured Parasutterella sp.]